jgi:hypothetical protein
LADQLKTENDSLSESDQEATELCDTLSALLGQVAVAARGPEEPKSRHGFHDLPSRVKTVVAERAQLKAKVMHQEAEAGTLAERMKAAGMMTVDELLAGAPLDAFTRHAGVNSLETFAQWLEMRRREYVTMQAKRTLDKREDDDLYEWVLAHAGVFGEVHVNFKAAMAAHEKNG